jgi:hypothetical protein
LDPFCHRRPLELLTLRSSGPQSLRNVDNSRFEKVRSRRLTLQVTRQRACVGRGIGGSGFASLVATSAEPAPTQFKSPTFATPSVSPSTNPARPTEPAISPAASPLAPAAPPQ